MTKDDDEQSQGSDLAGVTGAVFVEQLKYGENPSMTPAALFKWTDDDPLALHKFQRIEGDERSLVGLTDVDCLLQVLTHLAAGHQLNFASVPYMAVGVKHGNACGAAVGNDREQVIHQMVGGDKRALFGGVVMTNIGISRRIAETLMSVQQNDPPRLFDGVFAPDFDDDAPEVLKRYQGKCRMMANPALGDLGIDSLDTSPRVRQVRGGYLRQPNYTFVLKLDESTVYGPPLGEQQKRDLITAWAIGCVSNSNTITIVRNGQLLGNGVGQQDRVGAAELAIKRARDAGHDTRGAVAWSDSFFPAPDGLVALAEAGISAIFASSGSKQDKQVIYSAGWNRVTLLMQPDEKVRGFAKH
jgi:phosphoribosylaminoimidazolecarboxamide formyltransferase/IMP cyclohydrolase